MRRFLPLLVIMLPLAMFAGTVTNTDWLRLTIVPLAQAPVIDGKVSAGEWDQAITVPGFTALGQTALIGNQPRAWLAWSPQALLVAAEIPLPPGQTAAATTTDFDGTVSQDDSIEVHLDRGHQHKDNFQFVINALGTHFDSLAGNAKWSGEWQAKALNTPGKWSCEFAIPWSAVGGAPQVSDMDGLNLIINSSYLGGTLSFAQLPSSSAHKTAEYAHLIYGKSPGLSVEGLDKMSRAISFRAVGNGKIAIYYTLSLVGEAVPLDTRSFTNDHAVTTIPINISAKPCQYTIAITALGPAGTLFSRQVSLVLEEELQVELQAFTKDQHLDLFLRPDLSQQTRFPNADTDYEITLSGPNGVVKQWQYKRPPTTNNATADLRLTAKDLPEGKLIFKVVATNRKSQATRTVERVLAENPLRPVWLGTMEGLSDKVPAPWTPMVFDGDNNAVLCWGRAYIFDKGPLPAQIKTRDTSVLAKPVAFTGKINGQPLEWTSGGFDAYDVAKNQIALRGNANTGNKTNCPLKMEGTARVDYDGMVRVDLTLTPGKPGATCDDLTLEIPLKTANARYLYHFPGQWGSVANSGFVPKGGWSHAFKPFVWLGDEDRGISWFCESDENWFPLNNPKALSVDPEGPITYLRCHLIAAETKLDKPLKYTFGFQATPVKQPDKTVWDYRITHAGGYGLEKMLSDTSGTITYPALGHVRKEEGTFECWYRPVVDSERNLPFEQRSQKDNRSIFEVQLAPGAKGSNYGLYWSGTVQGLVAWARTDGIVTDNPGYDFDWKAGEWHHIGMTWDKEHLRLYLDGKVVSETPNNGFLAAPLDKAEICIGGGVVLAAIDEVRILSVARPPTVSDKPYVKDDQTLLLDHFDNYSDKTITPVPARSFLHKLRAFILSAPAGSEVSRSEGVKVGTPIGEVKFVTGKFGLAPAWELRPRLEKFAERGVRTICFHEHWVPYQSYPHVTETDRPRLRNLVEGIHANKMNLLLYMSRQLGDNAPEWELYNKEACSEPLSWPYRRGSSKAYVACWKGPYKDFTLYWLGKTMDEFGNDGWYLDGSEWPTACVNRSHGCGYVAPDGTVRPIWDIFATREFMQRLYVLTRSRKPQGQLNIHNSTVMVIPTLGWGTSTWGGEQIDTYKAKDGVKTLDILPMDAFRTEFMGRQWGVPAEFLVYEGMPYYSKDVLAYTLLHGILIRDANSIVLSALWKVHDEFPFSHGEMLGYWNNAEYIKVGPQGVYASIWRLPKQGALIVISNLTDTDASAQLALNLSKLASGQKITDAMTGETLAHQKGKLALPVASWRYRVLRVK